MAFIIITVEPVIERYNLNLDSIEAENFSV